MAIIIPSGLTTEEIRVLQEFRRLTTDALALPAIVAIRHPAGGGEPPAAGLVTKGYLARNGDTFTLTEKGKAFLAIDAKP